SIPSHNTIPALSGFMLSNPPSPRSTLFPYTTLFRSECIHVGEIDSLGSVGGNPLTVVQASHCSCGGIDLPCLARKNATSATIIRSEEHTSELQSPDHLVCRLLLEKKKIT